MATYVRQSSFSDGDTITAALFNNEFNQLVNAFDVASGHTHNGSTAGDGGPISNLFSNALVFGTNTNNDIAITFNATSNDGVLTWMEDEDYFKFSDDILLTTTEKVQFRDTAIYINSSTDGQLDIVADTEIQIAATTIDINGNADISGNLGVGGNLTVTGTTTFNGGTITMGDAATDNIVFGADVDSNIIPDDDDTYDLGSSTQQWRNLFIDGTANIDSLVADTADINGGTIDAANITVGSGKTLNVSAGTLTLADNQISGDKVEGGTINATTINTLTYGSITDGTITVTAFVDEDNMASNSATLIPTQQSVKAYVDAQDTAQDLDLVSDSGTIAIDLDGETLTVTGGEGIDTSATSNTLTITGEDATTSNKGIASFNSDDFNVSSGAVTLATTSTAAELNLLDGTTAGTIVASKGVAVDANKDITGFRNITLTGELDAATGDFSGAVDIADALDVHGALGINNTATVATNKKIQFRDAAIHISSSADGQLDIVADTEIQIVATTIDINGAVALNGAVTGGTNITISGELDAATLDISGNADIDGTLEADAITIAGVTLAETISDTVGAMVASNTETGIVVTYDDADNTLDFVIGDNAIVQSMIADNAIDSQMYVDGSIDTVHIADSQITSAKIADGTIATGDIADDAVTGAKLANNIDVAGTLDVTGVLTADSNVVIAGNLTVQGDTTTLNTATLDVEDKNITLNKGAGDTSGSANGAGLTIQDAIDASNDATILWDTTNDEFDFSHPINVAGKVTSTGTSVFASLDISGDIDVDGTTNLDVVDIDGAVDMASTLAVAGVVTANAGVVVDTMTLDGSTLTATGDFIVDAAADIIFDADANDVLFKDGGVEYFRITNNGTSTVKLDAVGDIILDADGGDIYLDDGGVGFGQISGASGNLTFKAATANKDIILQGNDSDGSNPTNMLVLDASAAGAATFSSTVTSTGLNVTSNTPVLTFIESDQSNKQYQIGSFGASFAIYDSSASQFRYIVDSNGNHLVNTGGLDCDFRVSSDGNTNMLFVDGGNNRVGVGTASPLSTLDVRGNTDVTGILTLSNNISDDSNKTATFISRQFDSGTETEGFLMMQTFANSSGNRIDIGGGTSQHNASSEINFFTAGNTTTRTGTNRLSIASSGAATFSAGATFGSHTRVNGDFSVSGASGKDRFAILPQSAGSGTIFFSGNAALNAYEPLTIDFETLALRTSGTARLSIAANGATTFAGNLTTTVPTGSGLLINSADIATIKMKSTGGGVKNWGFATTNLAASDFGIYQSNANGGDPITAGAAKLYFNSGSNTATFAGNVIAPAVTINGQLNVTGSDSNQIFSPQVSTQFDTSSFMRFHPTSTIDNGGFTNIFFGTSTLNNYGVAIGGKRAGSDGTPSFQVRMQNDSISGTEVLSINNAGAATFSGTIIGNSGLQLPDVAQSIDFIQSGAINFDANGDQTGRVLVIGSNRANGESGGITNVTFDETGGTVFNEGGATANFRVEADADANMFHVSGGGNTVSVGTTSNITTSRFEVQGVDNRHGMGQKSFSLIAGTSHPSKSVDGVMAFNTASSGSQLSIPITSQGNQHRPALIELTFLTGEYNTSGNVKSGFVRLAFQSLTSIGSLVELDKSGNVASIAASGMNILINFTSAYTAGQSNHEGVMCYYRIMHEQPQYVKMWDAALN